MVSAEEKNEQEINCLENLTMGRELQPISVIIFPTQFLARLVLKMRDSHPHWEVMLTYAIFPQGWLSSSVFALAALRCKWKLSGSSWLSNSDSNSAELHPARINYCPLPSLSPLRQPSEKWWRVREKFSYLTSPLLPLLSSPACPSETPRDHFTRFSQDHLSPTSAQGGNGDIIDCSGRGPMRISSTEKNTDYLWLW